MWIKCHSTSRCLQGFNHALSPDESPGLCDVPEEAELSFGCVGVQLQEARLPGFGSDPSAASLTSLVCKCNLLVSGPSSFGSEVFVGC